MSKWPWILGGAVVAAGVVVGVRQAFARSRSGGEADAAPEAPQSAAAPRARLVVALGDSITAGYLPRLKAMLPSGQVDGEGFTGKQVSYIAGRAGSYLGRQPTHVVVQGGINNLASGHGAMKVAEQLVSLWSLAKQGGARVIAVTVHPCPKNAACRKAEGERVKLNAMIKASQGAAAGPDVVVDVEDMPPEYLGGDGLHPTAAGQKWLAERVAGVL